MKTRGDKIRRHVRRNAASRKDQMMNLEFGGWGKKERDRYRGRGMHQISRNRRRWPFFSHLIWISPHFSGGSEDSVFIFLSPFLSYDWPGSRNGWPLRPLPSGQSPANKCANHCVRPHPNQHCHRRFTIRVTHNNHGEWETECSWSSHEGMKEKGNKLSETGFSNVFIE